MVKYYVLFKGNNISGKKRISVQVLKNKFEHPKYKNVITCLVSISVFHE